MMHQLLISLLLEAAALSLHTAEPTNKARTSSIAAAADGRLIVLLCILMGRR